MENQNLTLEKKPTEVSKGSFFKPVIQKKLSIGSPNDSYEVEADTVADKVMRMSEPTQQNVSQTGALIQKKCAHCQEEELRRKPLAESITPLIQRVANHAGGESVASDGVTSQINSSRGGGSKMDHGTQHFMESRFGTDFSGVRIHTGSQAVQMSRELNAQAFTVGNDVFFNEGKYSPNSDSGRHLLAHELTHTVQQGRSSGLAMRRIQRSVTTWGGTWDANPYDKKQDEANGTAYPAAMGIRGADITLKFTPNANVNAQLIGLTQTAQSVSNGAHPFIDGNPNREKRAISTGTEKGTMIDRADGFNNPIYAVNTQPSLSLDDTSTSAGWGQLGWNNSSLTPTMKVATLIDTPRLTGASTNSSQIFETTALATKGVQAGTYFGSVRWGWRTDTAGLHTLIPLSSISQGAPSATFMTAAGIWNTAKDSTGANTLDLPVVDVKYINKFTGVRFGLGPVYTYLPYGTRVEVLPGFISMFEVNIRVVDGPNTGETGKVGILDLSDERP
jgi:Domain of unknown function (DUF4157)